MSGPTATKEVIIQAGQSLSEMFLIADGVAQVSGDKAGPACC